MTDRGAGDSSRRPAPAPRASVAARTALDAIVPYVPGRPPPDVPGALKLASNESPLGPSPRAVAAMRAALSSVHRYPDAGAHDLKAAIAARHGLATANVLVGNGSDDVIHLLGAAYLEPGRVVVLPDPPYGIHRIVAQATSAGIRLVPVRDGVHDLDAMAAAAESNGWVVVTNPHNPTGAAVRPHDLERFIASVRPDTLVLLDEAYYDYADDAHRWTGTDVLGEHPNLVVLRTFSKAFGLAGVRVGYALADPALLAPVEKVRPPFNVGVPAQAGARAALDDTAHLARTVATNAEARAAFLAACGRLGLEAIPSQTNFVLVRDEPRGGERPAETMSAGRPGDGPSGDGSPGGRAHRGRAAGDRPGWPEVLAAAGITVRPGANLGVPGWHRVTLGTPEDMVRVAALIEEALG